MDTKIKSLNMELTQMYKWEDDLYHRYSVFCGLSDPALWVLYSLYEDEEKTYTQNDFVSMWFYPKQTVNYTVSGLVKRLDHIGTNACGTKQQNNSSYRRRQAYLRGKNSAADDGRGEFAETND